MGKNNERRLKTSHCRRCFGGIGVHRSAALAKSVFGRIPRIPGDSRNHIYTNQAIREKIMIYRANLDGPWCIYWIRKPEHDNIRTEGYVGYTANFHQRMREHKTTMDKCFGNGLDLDWNTLIKSKIVEFDKVEDAKVYENCLRNEPSIGWNKSSGGHAGSKRCEETRAKISDSMKGKTGSKSRNYKGPMIGTDPETGEILHRFEGRAAAKAAGFNPSNIYKVINGKRGFKTHKGHTWHRETIQPADSQEIKGIAR